jgi:ribulose 1,5-bisphosphate synthetase/thiazole synthase
MIQMKYEDSFIPQPGTTQAGLVRTASNGGSVGPGGSGVIEVNDTGIKPSILSLREGARDIPVLGEVDVLVCGGGPGGIGASVAAARTGAKTLLLERYGFLGGMATGGMVVPHFDSYLNDGINLEIVAGLDERKAWGAPHWKISYDPEVFKQVTEEMLLKSGGDVLYHSMAVAAIMEDNTMRGVVIETKSGRFAILAKNVIDATGDGDMAARAGAPLVRGRESDGQMQAMTLMFRMGGVKWVQTNAKQLFQMVLQAAEKNNSPFKLAFEQPWALHVPNPDTVIFQLVHVRGVDATDVRAMTRAEIDGRRQVMAVTDFLVHNTEEFKNAFLIDSASQFGVRETRHILGDYILTGDDLIAGRSFDDGIASCAFPIDIHRPDDQGQTGISLKRPYQIPYRSLLVRGIENLLTAGRCISGTYEAHASYRVKGPCLAIGQAAGAAAALAAQKGVTPRGLDVCDLQKELIRQGVRLNSGDLPDRRLERE